MGMLGQAKGFFGGIVDIFCPPLCLLCGALSLPNRSEAAARQDFCPKCLAEMKVLPPAHCGVCGLPFETGIDSVHTCSACRMKKPPYRRALAAGLYRDGLRKAVHAFKFQGRTELAGALARWMADRIGPPFYPAEADLVLPVPLHTRRLRQRGFNQALMLANRLYGDQRGLVRRDLLLRTKWTRPQVELKAAQRDKNVSKAFSLSEPEVVSGKRIILLDDVYTTGSTMRECARTVKKAGADTVLVLTLARVG